MKKVTESVVLACDASTYWGLLFDEAYLKELYLQVLGFKDFAMIDKSERARKLRIVPKVNLPGPLAKMIGDRFTYEEHGTLDAASNLWTWKMVAKNDMVATRGTIRVEKSGEAAVRRTDEVIIEAHLFGLGGLLENSVEKELRSAWAKEFAFLQRRFPAR